MSGRSDQPAPVAPDDQVIARAAVLIRHWTGMTFGENKRYYIERRLVERMAKTGIAAPAAYLDFATYMPGERQELINAFTVNETYFYREIHHLSALSGHMLPSIVRHRVPGDLIRIWSMPCATGEEAYSIAIWLLENWALVDAFNIEIVGSDIDTAALAKARDGHFSQRSLARLPEQIRESYFEIEKGHQRQIIQDLRESVRFTPANLIDPSSVEGLGSFDVILCRNLLIYFDDDARKRAADLLYDRLKLGGYLCLGHSESMKNISDRFEATRLDDAIVYRRP
ncbi:CheR family methyltransferase [Novosphingobium terrae]|uniref:CheR family methyltransferase n=1 Tax=Novosphingobium terrae TaxID=2726189 RepID=UPI001F1429E6|nr:protein-glutamate O-methyltransferase CheR [Novosphingobium terrae]